MVYGVDEPFSTNQNVLARKEIPAKYFNPILGVFLPASARLVLAAAESIVLSHRDGYVVYMDTDSIMVSPKYANEIQFIFHAHYIHMRKITIEIQDSDYMDFQFTADNSGLKVDEKISEIIQYYIIIERNRKKFSQNTLV